MRSKNQYNSKVVSALLSVAKLSIIMISALMVVVTLAQVIFRYVIAAPLPWSEEMARYCFVWVVFLGGAVGLARGIHLGVDLFVNALSGRSARTLEAAVALSIAGFALVVLYNSFPVIRLNMLQRSPALGVQMAWIYLAIPVSMGLICLISLERFINVLRGPDASGDI